MATSITGEVEKVWACRIFLWAEKGEARGIKASWAAEPLFFGRYAELKGLVSVKRLPVPVILDIEEKIDREHRFVNWVGAGRKEADKEDWMDAYPGQRLSNILEIEFAVKEADIFRDDLIFSLGNVGGGSNLRPAELLFIPADDPQKNLLNLLSLQERYERNIIFFRVLTDVAKTVTDLELSAVWKVSGSGESITRPEYFFDVGLQFDFEGKGQTLGELLGGGAAKPPQRTSYRLLGRSRELDSGPIELKCHLAFVYWNPVQKKYMGVPPDLEVRVVDYDPVSSNDVIGRGKITGHEGKVNIISINKDEGNPDVFFELLTNGGFLELETNRILTADKRDSTKHYLALPRQWSSRDKYRGYFDDFEGLSIGSGAEPLTFDITAAHPEERGPFSVGSTNFTAPSLDIGGGLEGWPHPVEVTMEALVRYPADTDGTNVPFSKRQSKFPVVILAHGRHNPIEFKRDSDGKRTDPVTFIKDTAGNAAEFKNFEGLEYLATHLASHGFIAVSINLNGKFNSSTRKAELAAISSSTFNPESCRPYVVKKVGVAHRGITILGHIRLLIEKNTSDPIFQNKIDVKNIALIGHSRGGEAVASAYSMYKTVNSILPSGSLGRIVALVSIAPTDSQNIDVDIPYLVLVGSDDGDVSDLQGLRLYDRAEPPKAMIWIVGAIHNYFSSNWHWQDEVPAEPSVTREQHQNIATGYCNAFLQQHVDNPEFHKTANGAGGIPPLFTGERSLRALAGSDVSLHFASRHKGALIVDDFEELPRNKDENSLKRAIKAVDIPPAAFDEVDLHHYRNAGACDINLSNWFQDTHGLRLEWSVDTAKYVTDLGDRSVKQFKVLSFRAGHDNSVGAPQNFRIRLTDNKQKSAALKVSNYGRIPSPRTKNVDGASVTMSVLGGIRLPLNKFREANPDLNLDAVRSLAFEFSEKAAGRLVFDDIEFSE